MTAPTPEWSAAKVAAKIVEQFGYHGHKGVLTEQITEALLAAAQPAQPASPGAEVVERVAKATTILKAASEHGNADPPLHAMDNYVACVNVLYRAVDAALAALQPPRRTG